MSGMEQELYGGELSKLFYGKDAVHVPMWMYVQDQGVQADGAYVSFVGSSHVVDQVHPLRYGSERTHQFIIGEVIVRPHIVLATDTLRGMGLGGLATNDHDLRRMLTDGEMLIAGNAALRYLRDTGALP